MAAFRISGPGAWARVVSLTLLYIKGAEKRSSDVTLNEVKDLMCLKR